MESVLRLESIEDVAGILGIPADFVCRLASRIDDNVKVVHKHKENGGYREICEPSAKLKRVQRAINKRILQQIPLPAILHGSVPQRSPKTNAEEHVGKPLILTLDIKDFYPNIHHTRILDLYLELGCSSEVAKLLTRLATYNGHLAQGFPTSSTLANLLLAKIAPRLEGISRHHGLKITSYQDDLTISGGYRSPKLINLIEKIFRQGGFALHRNDDKRKLMPRTRRQQVTGYVVNRKTNVSKDEYRKIRAAVYLCRVRGVDAMAGDMPVEQFLQHLRGRVQRVIEVNPKRGEQLLIDLEALEI
jgi:RNA-directed DNA polymerase